MRAADLTSILDTHGEDLTGAASAIAAAATDRDELARAFGVVLRFGVLRAEPAQGLLRALRAIGMDAQPPEDPELQEMKEVVAALQQRQHELQRVEWERAEVIARVDESRRQMSWLTDELTACRHEAERIAREQEQVSAVEKEAHKWISPSC